MSCCRVWMGFHEAEAEEAFARARMEIYLQFPRYGSRLRDPAAWLRRVTYNICMDLHRERHRRREQALESVDSTVPPAHGLSTKVGRNPEQLSLGNELRAVLRQAITALPERLREVVVLRAQSLSHRQVAERLAITEATSRKRMQEARAVLRGRLERYHKGEIESAVSAESALPLHSPPRRRRMPRVVRVRCQEVRRPDDWSEEALLMMTSPVDERRREVLEHYVQAHPSGWKGRLLLARRLLQEGHPSEALGHLESLTRRHGERPELWLTLAAAQMLRGDEAALQEVYGRAAAAVRSGAGLLFEGLRDLSLGHPRRAVKILTKAARQAPKDTLPRIALASAHRAQGRPVEATAALDEAMARDPKDVAALVSGYRALGLLGRDQEFQGRMRRALELDPENAIALSWLLLCPGSVDRSGSADGSALREKARKRIEEQARRSVTAAAILAGLHLVEGQPAQADRMLARWTTKRPRLLSARLARTRFLDLLQCPRAAWAVLEPAFDMASSSRRQVDLLACRLAPRAGRAAEVPRRVDRLLDRHGLDWETAAGAAMALAAAGVEPERALELGRAAVTAQPELPAAHLALGCLLLALSRGRAAIEPLSEAWALLPEPRRGSLAGLVARAVSEAHTASGKTSTAVSWMRRSCEAGGSPLARLHGVSAWEVSWLGFPEDGPQVLV